MGLVDKGRMPAPLTKLFNMSRSYSLWVYQWGLACCAIEMGAAFGSPRYDVMRLGVIPLPASPRQADFVCVSGTVTHRIVATRCPPTSHPFTDWTRQPTEDTHRHHVFVNGLMCLNGSTYLNGN